jgi:Ca-activated chloride channel homolog
MELEAKLERKYVAPGSRDKNHLLIKLKTPPPPTIVARQPLVIGLAIDKSWSMKGEKITATIEAASALVNWLTRNDYITVIAYSADVQVVQPLIQLKDKSVVIDKLNSIQVATSTNLSGGWLQALRAVEASDVPNAYKRVILLTDGQATMGIRDPLQFNQIAADHFSRGVTTTTIGFGEDFNENSLREIALAGGGNFYYVHSPEQTNDIFFKEFGDIGALYAQAIEIKVKLASGIKILELLNDYPIQKISEDTFSIQPGDIRSDDTKTIVLSVEIQGEPEMYDKSILSAEVSYYNLFEKMKFEQISSKIFISNSELENRTDSEVVVERLVSTAARTMFRASKLIQDNEITHAQEMVRSMIDRIDEFVSHSPEILRPLLNRLKIMEAKLKENIGSASKQLMAVGSEIYSRTDMFDLTGVELHDSIFEFQSAGDIDLYKCPDIKAVVQAQMNEGYRFMIFDLSNTRHVDSSGIGTFIQVVGWLRRRGGELVVANIVDSVRKVFSITRLENHIRVARSVQEARDAIQSIIDSRNS